MLAFYSQVGCGSVMLRKATTYFEIANLFGMALALVKCFLKPVTWISSVIGGCGWDVSLLLKD